jgi:hypothetical protein
VGIAARLPDAVGDFLAGVDLRLEITTLAPSFASSSAEARPMPRLEPVMTATRPVRSNGVFFKVYLLRSCPMPSLRGAQATKQSMSCFRAAGLLRFARNDGMSAFATLKPGNDE